MDQYFLAVYDWVIKAKALNPEVCSWIGVYFKDSYLNGADNTDLVLGPFLGEPTEHTRISINRGMCGLALREERVVNLSDVHSDARHIACSLKTKSELVIPIKNSKGEFVAELDIDSNSYASFTPEIEELFKDYCESFPFKEDYLPMNMSFRLETDRLIIRPIKESDLDAVFEYASNPNVAEYVTFNPHETIKDTERFFEYAKKNYLEGMFEPMGITLKDAHDDRVVGTIGLFSRGRKSFTAEFGYALHHKLWGRGIMTEALLAMIEFAFSNLPYHRLQAHCMEGNPASGRVMEKAGMTYEGTFRDLMYVKEKFRTLRCYAILKNEWEKQLEKN